MYIHGKTNNITQYYLTVRDWILLSRKKENSIMKAIAYIESHPSHEDQYYGHH